MVPTKTGTRAVAASGVTAVNESAVASEWVEEVKNVAVV
jgi:hypothetical protein